MTDSTRRHSRHSAGGTVPSTDRRETTDDLDALLSTLPPEIGERIRAIAATRDVIEVVMDLGRRPEARFGSGGEEVLLDREIAETDLQYVVDHIGSFGEDNRAGIERTLHRISAIRNRTGKIVGLTCRIGRAVFGTIEIIDDLVESGKSILIMGRPGIGKTTMLREAARVLADVLDKRVVVVDTSNEIAGDGDIAHPGIGRARRMQVRTPAHQHGVMIEAVENHMPEVIVIDEIGTEQEASAARTIAERGVQLVGTAHGNSLDNLMLNPTLSDLIGGIQTVTLGDEEARRRRTQKSVLERKAPPTFEILVEIQDRDRVVVHTDVAETVDALLRGDQSAPELRWRDEGGVHRSQARPRPGPATPGRPVSVLPGPFHQMPGERFGGLVGQGQAGWRVEPGWRPEGRRSDAGPAGSGVREAERGARPGYWPGAGGGWRSTRGRSSRTAGREGPSAPWEADTGGNRVADRPAAAPFQAGSVADRGPLERGTPTPPEARARDAREFERQAAWRTSAARAIAQLRGDPLSEGGAEPVAERDAAGMGTATWPPTDLDAWLTPRGGDGRERGDDRDGEGSEADDDDAGLIRLSDGRAEAPVPLDTMHILAVGISRKRLEQSVRQLGLPVVVVQDADDAHAVITLRNTYKQKLPALREAEARGVPIYVLKTNTVLQMETCLTSLFSLDLDPSEAALREVEEAIGLVTTESRPVELSPQSPALRRLQHQVAERANLRSLSRGREPYRRVRVYPDRVRAWR